MPELPKSPKSRPNCATAFSQAVAIQRVLLADSLNPETSASVRAQVARAWCELEERKRILKMKPKPRDVEVKPKVKKHAPASGIEADDMPEQPPNAA